MNTDRKVSIYEANIDGCVTLTFMVLIKGKIVAQATIEDWQKSGGWIYKLSVLPKYQGQGIGTQLLEAIFQEATDKGKQGLGLGVHKKNQRAQNLYERLGFVACYEAEPHIIMTKHL